MLKAKIDNEFIIELLKEGLIFEYKPYSYKLLNEDKEVLIVER